LLNIFTKNISFPLFNIILPLLVQEEEEMFYSDLKSPCALRDSSFWQGHKFATQYNGWLPKAFTQFY